MAHSKENMLLYKFSGKVGNMLYKNYGDKTVLSKIPNMKNRILSEKQIQANLLMKTANAAVKRLIADPIAKEEAGRRLRVPDNKLYRALIKEYLQKKGNV